MPRIAPRQYAEVGEECGRAGIVSVQAARQAEGMAARSSVPHFGVEGFEGTARESSWREYRMDARFHRRRKKYISLEAFTGKTVRLKATRASVQQSERVRCLSGER